MNVTDIKLAAREELMRAMQQGIVNMKDERIAARAVNEFRRVEKLFGFEPGSWSAYP